MSLPSTAANTIPKHPDMLNFKGLWNRLTEHHITELLIRLNEGGNVEKTTVTRLRQGQRKLGAIKCLLTNQDLLHKRGYKVKNLGLKVL